MSSNAVVELAKDWYYCLSLSYYATPTVASNTSVAGTFDWAMANMSATNSNYKLSVILDRTFTNPPAALYCTNAAGAYATNISGVTEYRVCPESDLQGAGDYWTNITSYWVDSLKTINSNGPIAIILNGGEYGLDVSAWGNFAWAQDPRVQAASVMTTPFCLQTNGWWDWSTLNTNGMSWAHYAALNKSRQLGYLTASINTNFPSRELSIFYHTGDEQGRQWNSDPHSYLYWKDLYSGWGWWSSYMNTNTDLPSCELYYSRTGWWTNEPPFVDLLTQYLNQVGYNFSIGYTNNYSWVEGGDDEVDGLSNVMTYTGFLKCLYICGMRGAIAGYFTTPNGPVGSLEGGLGFNAPFPASSPPHWIQQLIQLSRVHALFSYLDSFTTNSSLISGPQMHVLSLDQPAYEFTNTVARANDRVVARKHRSRDEWLVCAWAADGVTTNVTVTIPTLGTKTLTALPEGNIYRGTTTKFGPVNEYGEIIIPSRVSNLRVSTIRGK